MSNEILALLITQALWHMRNDHTERSLEDQQEYAELMDDLEDAVEYLTLKGDTI